MEPRRSRAYRLPRGAAFWHPADRPAIPHAVWDRLRPQHQLSHAFMGGFFLSNSHEANQRARAHFARLQLPHTDLRLGTYHLTLLQKKHVRAHKNWFERDGDIVAGVGFWLADNAAGEKALPGILDNLQHAEHRLGELTGNAAFLFKKGSEVGLVTDRTGHYPVYTLKDGNLIAYSSSILALASVAGKLSFNRQALQEFVNLEAVLGYDTAFEQIECLRPGLVLSLPDAERCQVSSRTYFNPVEEPLPLPQLQAQLVEHLSRLTNTEFGPADICCDLSGGFDSRTVAALVHRAGVAHTLNTNVNRIEPGDHLAAIEAAVSTGRPIVVYNISPSPEETPSIDDVFWSLDLARNLPRARLTMLTMEVKAARHALVLGGYGGALFRDEFSRRRNLSEVVELDCCKGLERAGYDRARYVARLKEKFHESLASLGVADDARATERLHLFEKMRSWGGSRIALYNRYTHHWHPLLDYRVQRHILTVPFQDKVAAAFQQVIIGLDEQLAKAPYIDSKKQSANSRPRSLVNRLRKIKDLPSRLEETIRAKAKARHEPLPAQYAAALPEFEALAGFKLSSCVSDVHRGRALTLVHTFTQFRDKLVP